ncbi:tRNA (guanosine(46)-N7)-methyltransferase TrmB [Candidatus Pseudothioglobus singularis]|nr:tRNA (guanosine(46)-N7)-methyltransferase TrmB [Candidatus Pseudothioglobus singularis]
MSEAKSHRKIQSFVKRSGRLSKAQSLGLNNLWSDFGIEVHNNEIINFEAAFVKKNAITLEIGFGNGDSLLETAINQPNQNFIGIEVYEAGVGRIINEASKQNVSNLLIIKDDAVEIMANNISDNSISNFQLFFPDPWHKKRHHKRRIIQTSFLDLLSRKLKTNGTVHIATDWQNYAEHIMKTLEMHPHFKNLAGDYIYSKRPKDRPLTKFENRGHKLGHGVWDLLFKNIKGG